MFAFFARLFGRRNRSDCPSVAPNAAAHTQTQSEPAAVRQQAYGVFVLDGEEFVLEHDSMAEETEHFAADFHFDNDNPLDSEQLAWITREADNPRNQADHPV